MAESDLLQAALRYAARGWFIFPVHVAQDGRCSCGRTAKQHDDDHLTGFGKHPRTLHGFHDASKDADTITKWWKQYPDANIGVAVSPSKLVLLDVDHKDGQAQGLESWHDLLQECGRDIADTITQETPSGGLHLLYGSNGSPIRNDNDGLGDGIEVKASSGYFIAWPSTFEGKRYIWAYDAAPDEHDLMVFPKVLADRLSNQVRTTHSADEKYRMGQRHDAMVRVAGAMRRQGAGPDEIEAALLIFNRERCIPPKSDSEVRSIAESMMIYDPAPVTEGKAPTDTDKGKRNRTIADHEIALKRLGYIFRLNRVSGKLEANGIPLDDPTLCSLRAKMRDIGFANSMAFEDVLWHLGLQNEYHPVRAYLHTCGMAYDGTPKITPLAACFHDVTTPHPLFACWLRRWLIGAVAKTMHDGDVHNNMLVLDGPQLLGKSFFATWLASELAGYFTRGRIDPDNKDCLIRYGENFVWETAELGATTRRADIDALKEFISAETVTVRRPYGKYDIKRPALASLIGTINNSGGFLADTTGNRRFLVAHIKQIDWGYSEDMSPGQVWGEAFTAYQQGEPWLPTRDELALSEENNELYMLPNPLESYLYRYFIVDPLKRDDWTSTGDIVAHLVECGYKAQGTRALSMEVANTLAKIGCLKYRKLSGYGQVWGYSGVRIAITSRPADLADLVY